jgi:hypothetical protein
MNRRKYGTKRLIFMLSLTIIVSHSCSTKLPDPKWRDNTSSVNATNESPQEDIAIDIYVDATTSMGGFALGKGTIYSQFIDQLEAGALSSWKKADVKYFKFGEIIKPIQRSEFLTAKDNLAFYRENGIFRKTYIDSVIKHTDTKRLSVVITDLFQDEGDVNIMVDQIKAQCFNRNVMLGIIGVKTEFNGLVFDTPGNPGGYKLNTKERPFYALIFGDPSKMEKLFEALKTKDFVKENQILLISNHILKSPIVSIVKTKDSKSVNKKAPRLQLNNSFDFSMKEKDKDAKFNLELSFEKNTRCVDFDENSLTAMVFKKSITDVKKPNPDSVMTDDFRIENLKRQGDKITATLVLKNENPEGNYSYLIYIQPNQINGFKLPSWVKNFSTDNPLPNTESASQTYNLEKLISRLLIAKNAITPTYISKLYINLYKH